MTTPEEAAILARLDAMDRERRDAREEYLSALKELRDEIRTVRMLVEERDRTVGDRLSSLEKEHEREKGRVEGRGGIGRAIVAAAAIAAALSAVFWALIDHTGT